MKIRLRNTLLAGLMATPFLVSAAALDDAPLVSSTTTVKTMLEHPALTDFKAQGLQVEARDDLPQIDGLTAWLVTNPKDDARTVLYTTVNQQYLLSVKAVDHQGVDPVISWLATEKVKLQEAINKPGDLVWQALDESLQIAPKNEDLVNNKLLYLFVDPNCSGCAEFWSYQADYQGQGVTFRTVPVSFIDEDDGHKKITAMLLADDPYRAYGINEQLFEQGGYPAAGKAHETIVKRVTANYELMTHLGITGTPAIVYQNDKGESHVAEVIDGQFFKEMGLELTKNDD